MFAETLFVSQADLSTTITKFLRIRDNSSPDSRALWNIVIVGQSTKTDLKILQRLGIDVFETVSVLAILDTHLVARNLLGFSFKLGAFLTELNCPYNRSDLRNAGNDATFMLQAMLMLAIKISESRELSFVQRQNLERLRAVAQMELYECQRWKPSRKSLGFYSPGSPIESNSNTLNNHSNR